MKQRANEWRRQAMDLSTLLWKRVGLWLSQAKLYIGTVSLVAQMAFVFAQAPNCYVLPVSRYDDWQVENLVGVTEDGVVAGTLVYRGQDSSVRIRRIPFRWSIHREQLEVLPPPVNDPEGEYITGIIAEDLSIDGTAIVGKIKYSGYNRPSAAFLWKAGTGYLVVKTRRIGTWFDQREVRAALSAVAVGHSGYHIVIQPENASSFVIAKLPTPPFSRCHRWFCNEMKVVVPKCRYGFLQDDGGEPTIEPLPKDYLPEIYLEMEVFSDTDSQSYLLRQYIPRFDWFNWWEFIGRRFPPPGRSVRVLVNDISQDGQWIVGSVQVPEGDYFCYSSPYGETYTLQGGEYIMRGQRYIAGTYSDWGYGPETCDHYVVEIRRYDREGRPIQGKATAIGESYNPYDDAFCDTGLPRWVAGLIFQGQDRNTLFLWDFSPPINDDGFFKYQHNGYGYCCQNIVSVCGIDVVGEAVGAGVDYRGDTRGYITSGYHLIDLHIWEPQGPIPAVSTCKEVVAISPNGRFIAVNYTDPCDGSPRVFAVIDRTMQFLQVRRPSQAIVAYRNLTSPDRRVPYYSDEIEIRLFLKIGNRWYSQRCGEEARRSRWYITGTTDVNDSRGEPSPDSSDDFTNDNTTNNRVLPNDILRNLLELPFTWDIYLTRWYWLSHRVDRETLLSPIVSRPCEDSGWRRYYYYPPYEHLNQQDGSYVFSLVAGSIPVLPEDVTIPYTRGNETMNCRVGTARLEARVIWWEEENRERVKRFIRSSGPKPGAYMSNDDNVPDANRTWSQNCDEASELALRISVRQGEGVVGWATSFLGVPYEMGGGWYGGRADNNWDSSHIDCGRSPYGDHQYGIDCNGMIWSSFNLSGRSFERIASRDYITSNRFEEVDLNEIQPGDILAARGHIMMVYSVIQRSSQSARIRIIDANGSAHRVRVTDEVTITYRDTDSDGRYYRVAGYSENYYLRRWREQRGGR